MIMTRDKGVLSSALQQIHENVHETLDTLLRIQEFSDFKNKEVVINLKTHLMSAQKEFI